MKLKIIADDGSIQGWFVAFMITFLRTAVFIGSYVVPGLAETEQKVGPGFTSFSLLSVGSWFTYKVIKPLTAGGEAK